MSIAAVCRATGLSRVVVTSLYRETTERIEYSVLEKLCFLFKCKVGDLIEWVPDDTPKSGEGTQGATV